MPRNPYKTRCQDPVKTLLALQALVPALLSHVADNLSVAELHALCEQLPPARRSLFELFIWKAVPSRLLGKRPNL